MFVHLFNLVAAALLGTCTRMVKPVVHSQLLTLASAVEGAMLIRQHHNPLFLENLYVQTSHMVISQPPP